MKITVEAGPGEGKSAVTALIADLLTKHGFSVSCEWPTLSNEESASIARNVADINPYVTIVQKNRRCG